jgi:predicted HTH transcriptional regulator
MQLQDVEKLIRNGESETVEFKMSTGQRTTTAKTLFGMLNRTGGNP